LKSAEIATALKVAEFQDVMPGLVPGIHVLAAEQAWMAETSPAMTTLGVVPMRDECGIGFLTPDAAR
jgi:hypothetical protein